MIPQHSYEPKEDDSPRMHPTLPCSASCRWERTRQREQAARDARDQEIRALLETALKKLQEGVP